MASPLNPILELVFEIIENVKKQASALEYAVDIGSRIPAIIAAAQELGGATKEELIAWSGEAADALVGADGYFKFDIPGMTPEEAEQFTDLLIKAIQAKFLESLSKDESGA
jgi:hypothetical protein